MGVVKELLESMRQRLDAATRERVDREPASTLELQATLISDMSKALMRANDQLATQTAAARHAWDDLRKAQESHGREKALATAANEELSADLARSSNLRVKAEERMATMMPIPEAGVSIVCVNAKGEFESKPVPARRFVLDVGYASADAEREDNDPSDGYDLTPLSEGFTLVTISVDEGMLDVRALEPNAEILKSDALLGELAAAHQRLRELSADAIRLQTEVRKLEELNALLAERVAKPASPANKIE